jgi:rRNA maturation RNase YbeY
MSIIFHIEDIKKPKLKRREIKEWIKAVAEIHNKKIGDINYIFCSDEYLLRINKEYLLHDYYTDIITFDYCSNNILSGDIFISIDRVNDNAVIYSTSETELYRVIIHGLLHLIGFDDHSEVDKKQMREQENNAIKMLR